MRTKTDEAYVLECNKQYKDAEQAEGKWRCQSVGSHDLIEINEKEIEKILDWLIVYLLFPEALPYQEKHQWLIAVHKNETNRLKILGRFQTITSK